jgi:hypothetical protein
MKAVCPTDPGHKKFVTIAHEAHDWVVDEAGNFLELAPNDDVQVTHGPQIGNTWTCFECGAEAKVSNYTEQLDKLSDPS